MRVFCTSCGQPNEAEPGSRVMCTSCTSVFEVPADARPGSADVPPGFAEPAPRPPQTVTPPRKVPPPPGWRPQAGTPVAQVPVAQPKTNTLAIVSLVSGIACCLPFSSLIAIGTGIAALSQLKQNPAEQGKSLAISGIVLGSLTMAVTLLGLAVNLLVGPHQ